MKKIKFNPEILNHTFLAIIVSNKARLGLLILLLLTTYLMPYASTEHKVPREFDKSGIKSFSFTSHINLGIDCIYPKFSPSTPLTSLSDTKSNVLNLITITSTLNPGYCTGQTATITFETSGVFNANNIYSLQLSNSSGSFTTPTVIGSVNSNSIGSNTISFKIPLETPIGNNYRMRVVSSSPFAVSANNGSNIQITTIAAPSILLTSQIICPSHTALLSATCKSGSVKWYDDATQGNIITNLTVSPTVSTDYFAACEDGAGCSSTRGKQIIIVNTPSALVPPYASTCLNSNLELAVITDETELSYAWTGPNGFYSTLQNPTIVDLTPTKEGVYSVSITNASNCSVVGTTAVIIGQTLQSLNVVGDISLCFNGTISLNASATPTSGMTYAWTGPNLFTATGQSLSRAASVVNSGGITTYNNGQYTVVASNANTGCSGTTSVDIAVSNRPNISATLPANSVCGGLDYPFNLAVSGANFQSYSWTGPSGFTASTLAVCDANNNCNNVSTTIPNFSSDNAGVYTLNGTYTDENSLSCVVTTTKNITLKPNPNISIGSNSGVCVGNPLNFVTTYTPSITDISTFSWTGPNNFTASIQNPSIPISTVVAIGTYKLMAVGVNSCVATATTFANVVQSLPPVVVPTAAVVLSNSITLTASGCAGTLEWYQSSDNQLVTMPVSPVSTKLYYGKCNLSGCVSSKSDDITVSIKPPIATSAKTGNWEDKTTWDIARVPLAIDSVIIKPVHIITINSIANAKWLAWSGFGNLKFASSNSRLNLFGNPPPPPPPITTPPILTSNPVSIVEGISVTFTASGSGVISWYKNDVSLNINGTNYTVNQPVKGDIYTAKRTENGLISVASNAIAVIATSTTTSTNVTITEPNKPPYYFSDGHPPSYYDGNLNLPAIFTNQPHYDPVNDLVWLKNDKIKIGINLKRGGQIAWASLADATNNLVYNGFDGGFQITLDAYERKDGYTQGGEVSGSGNPGMPTSYNVTHGGDYQNHAVSLIDYHSVPNGYYVKLRPIHYPLTAKFSQTYIEVTYTIIRRSVKIEYRYTSYRTDGQWDGGGFDGAGAPACFMVNTLNKFKTYEGGSPWSFLPVFGRDLPVTNWGQNPIGTQSTEYWGMVYSDQYPNSGVGVYNATNGGNSTYFTFKQMDVYTGVPPGDEFIGGFTFFQPFIDFNITNRSNYVKDITAYLMIGSELEIRSEVYKFSGHESNIPKF